MRAIFVSLNIFSIACDNKKLTSYPGAIKAYGGPILYLLFQSVLLLAILIWRDSGSLINNPFRLHSHKSEDAEAPQAADDEVAAELARVRKSTDDGLRVLHLSKSFGKTLVVQNISFGVKRGEVFALLGPNGAGKSTTIEMIRGDLRPSHHNGEIFIENNSVISDRAAARQHLGVCPQFDAIDQMTVMEHLQFYARIRGVSDVGYNVKAVLCAVGLELYQFRPAAALSGGNKRKLSLGIALMGNPTVLLLDEPSSGMDVAAKRIMWKTLAKVAVDRSIVLTTHSMEEADALADRAGIMASRMLALGTSDYLRRKHGNLYHVHLLLKTAPHTSVAETSQVGAWIHENLPKARIDEKAFHGQIRFSIPASTMPAPTVPSDKDEIRAVFPAPRSSIGALFVLLELHKRELGFEYYSVNQTTFDHVFSTIIRRHDVEEEGYETKVPRRGIWRAWGAMRRLGRRRDR